MPFILGIDVTILRDNLYLVSFSENVFCTCTPSQRADRKTCCHVIWLLLNLFGMEEEGNILAQDSLDRSTLSVLYQKCHDNVPEALSKCFERPVKRIFHPLITSHDLCDTEQTWYVQRKKRKASTCAGCLKKDIDCIYLAVYGLIFLKAQNLVVQTMHRFCPSRSCVTT